MADIPPSTFKRDMDFGRNRVEPRRFGVWRYGVGRYSASDPTRFAWSRVAPAAIALFLAFLFALPASAADTFTPALNLQKPDVNVEDPNEPWGAKINRNFDTLDDAICDKRVGCTITGQLIVITTITAGAVIAESSVTVQAPLTGDGLIGTPIGVDSSSVTLLGPSIGASEVDADIATQAELQTVADDVAAATNTLTTDKLNRTGDDTITGTLSVSGNLNQGSKSLLQIRSLVCPGGSNRCVVYPSDEKGTVYRSSGALAGQYINNRGVGP